MTPTETAAKLRHFNAWRRDFDDKFEQPDSHEVSEAIDAAIEMIERLEAAEKSDAELLAMYRRVRDERDALRANLDDHRALVSVLREEVTKLRARIEAMEKQEPVAAQQRFQRQQEMMAVWLPWQTTELRKGRPARAVDVHGLNVEYRELYAIPGAKGEEK